MQKAEELSVMNKAIKYRLYPTTEQKEMFAKTFGCCRKVYNLMLADKLESYDKTGKFVSEMVFLNSNLPNTAGSHTQQTISMVRLLLSATVLSYLKLVK